jgi:hypothetical protein
VISGVNQKGEKVRWIEGVGPVPAGVQWSHIYVCVGWPPFNPAAWEFAEPTLPVPLGWDVVSAPKDGNGRVRLPEMEAKPSKLLAGTGLGMVESTGRATSPDAPVPARAPEPAPVPKWRAFASSIPLPQVAATVIAGVLSYVLTQQVIAPRFRARGGRSR